MFVGKDDVTGFIYLHTYFFSKFKVICFWKNLKKKIICKTYLEKFVDLLHCHSGSGKLFQVWIIPFASTFRQHLTTKNFKYGQCMCSGLFSGLCLGTTQQACYQNVPKKIFFKGYKPWFLITRSMSSFLVLAVLPEKYHRSCQSVLWSMSRP